MTEGLEWMLDGRRGSADGVLDLHAPWACRVVGSRTQREITIIRFSLLLFIPSVLCGVSVWALASGCSRWHETLNTQSLHAEMLHRNGALHGVWADVGSVLHAVWVGNDALHAVWAFPLLAAFLL